MKTLSKFLALHILDRRDFDNQEWQEVLEDYTKLIHKGLEVYAKYLQQDTPNTVQWAMIERKIINALQKAESVNDHLHSEFGTKLNTNNGASCLEPSTYVEPDFGCVKCKSIIKCHDRKDKHCKNCLLFNLKAQGNCNEPGYNTRATNRACDRFKLKVLKEINEAGFHEVNN